MPMPQLAGARAIEAAYEHLGSPGSACGRSRAQQLRWSALFIDSNFRCKGGIAMKKLSNWGLAAAFLVATAMPAMAKSWDVCIDPSKDLNASSESVATGVPLFFTAVAPIFPAGTFSVSMSQLSCTTAAASVGTFMAKGGGVSNLPTVTNEVFFVDWNFVFKAGGAFDTSGPVRAVAPGSTYSQTITGSIGGKAAATGKAVVKVLSSVGSGTSTVDAFRITVP
jgi:hypothetical protein